MWHVERFWLAGQQGALKNLSIDDSRIVVGYHLVSTCATGPPKTELNFGSPLAASNALKRSFF